METSNQNEKPNFQTNFDNEELQHILDIIDNHLTFQQIDQQLNSPKMDQLNSSPNLPSLDKLIDLSDWIKMSSAPLRRTMGVRGLKGLIYRLLNLPIRIFGVPEIEQNRKFREFIDELMVFLYAFNEQAAVTKSAFETLESKISVLLDLENTMKLVQQEIIENNKAINNYEILLRSELSQYKNAFDERLKQNQDTFDENIKQNQSNINEKLMQNPNIIINEMEKIQETIESLKTHLSMLHNELAMHESWNKSQDERYLGMEKWIQLIGSELKDVSLETRSLTEEHTTQVKTPIIQKPLEFARKIQAMQGKVKINLGSGHKSLEDYINIDFRELPELDLVSDVNYLPFSPNTVDELASSHLIEHFREYVLTNRLLPYWYSLIKNGGMIRIICPNWKAMIDRLNSGDMSISQFKLLTFGGQDYDGNDHFAMYTPETLSKILTNIGFENVQVLVVDRDNGGCPEMEIIANKPN